MNTATVYDAVNTALFAPAGGSRQLRRCFVDQLDVDSGDRVLELGSGTGQVTAELTRRSDDVTAYDRLPEMVEATRQRAPAAKVLDGDIQGLTGREGRYDLIVLAFVLHSATAEQRAALLRTCGDLLAPGGRLGILEWQIPARPRAAAAWRAVLDRLEPHSDRVAQILAGALDQELDGAGLRTHHRADGPLHTTQTILARKAP